MQRKDILQGSHVPSENINKLTLLATLADQTGLALTLLLTVKR
jgi:hypothetical protein